MYTDGSTRNFYGMRHHFEMFICGTSISPFFALGLANRSLPYFPESELASQDAFYTSDFQLLMPKMSVNKALVIVSTTFKIKINAPSLLLLCWIFRPTNRYCLLPQLHCSVSFLSQWSTGREAPSKQQHFRSDSPFQSLHYQGIGRKRLFKSHCKTPEERTRHAKFMLCYETQSPDMLSETNNCCQQNSSPA